MPKTLHIQDVEKVKSEIQHYFTVNENARFVRRLDIIALICDEHPINYVSSLFHLNPTTVQRWIHRFNESGFDGLKDKAGRGRRSKLSNDDKLRIAKELQEPPAEFGYRQSRWDGKLLSYHLKKHYAVELKVRQCQNLFKQLGFSLQRPRKMPTGSDPEKRKAFKKNSK